MRPVLMWRRVAPRLAGAVMLILLAGCATRSSRPGLPPSEAEAAQANREAQLATQPQWSLLGKVAVRNASDGGSGQVDWQTGPAGSEFALRAPVTGQGWRLRVDGDGAVLDGLPEGRQTHADPTQLLRDRLGWELPFGSLLSWVRGARADGDAELAFALDGLPSRLRQHGWTIVYQDWYRDLDPPLPRRLSASRGEQSVRLVIRQWKLGQ